MPTGKEYQVSIPLTTMIQDKVRAYQGVFVATDIFPPVKVNRPVGQFWDNGLEALRLAATERAPGTIGPTGGAEEGSWVAYALKQYSMALPITAEEAQAAKDNPNIDLEAERADLCLARVLLAREKRVADIIADDSNFLPSNIRTLDAREKWNNHTGEGHDIVGDIRTAIEALRPLKATHIIAPAACQIATWGSPSLAEWYKYVAGPQYLQGGGLWGQKFMGLDVITPDAAYLSSAKGATDVVADLFGDNVVILARGTMTGNAFYGWGCSFVYPTEDNLVVETWGDYENSPELTKFVRVRDQGRQEKVLHVAAAYKIADVLA